MRSIADYQHHRATLPALAWLLLVHVLATCDPAGRLESSIPELARMVDTRAARVVLLLDELVHEGILTAKSTDLDGGVQIELIGRKTMTTTTTATETPATSVELDTQLANLREQHEAAVEAVDAEGDAFQLVDGRRRLGEADEEEVGAARLALTDAEAAARSLASAVALVESRLAQAITRERDERRAALATEADAAVRRHAKAVRATLPKALSGVRDAFADRDGAAADLRGIRSALMELRDLNAEEAARRRRKREEYDELRRGAPEGMQPNADLLARQLDAEIESLREAAAREVAAIAPDPDAAELAALCDEFADLVPLLMDTATRQALSEGAEFLNGPQGVTRSGYTLGQRTECVYGDAEFPEALRRFEALRDAVSRLGGPPALTVAQIAGRATRSEPQATRSAH